SYNYAWYLNGSLISGVHGNTLNVSQDGVYKVVAGNAFCPSVSSEEVFVKSLSAAVHLGADTTVCQTPFSKMLIVDPEFSNVFWSNGAEHTWAIEISEPGIYWV